MLDTLMVLWTRGIFTRFMRVTVSLLLLFMALGVVLLLATTSGIKLPGLAFNALPSDSAPPMTRHPAVATPTTTGEAALGIPVILHNPTPTLAVPTPTADMASAPDKVSVPETTSPAASTNPPHVAHPAPTRTVHHTPTPTPTETLWPEPTQGAQPWQPWFSNAISANGGLAGSLASSSSFLTLQSLFWIGLVASLAMIAGCLGLLITSRKKKSQRIF